MKRRAIVAGASGLVGRGLLDRLLADERYASVHALVRRPLGVDSPRLHELHADFDMLDALAPIAADDVFCCLGTTIRAAGSEAAFRRVDYDYVLAFARYGLRCGARRFVLVSSMGASPDSRIFYSRVKGQTEAAVSALAYESTTIVRPSLLAGERTESRPAERLSLMILRPLAVLVPAKYRPIEAERVAEAMIRAAIEAAPGARALESDRL